MERLSSLDASFLYLERPQTPMHISSLAIYEGPQPSHTELRTMLERRLHLVPRFRQRLATVPFGAHRPMWIDDDRFDLDAHLQRVALPERTDEALLQLAGRILSTPLCRTRPMWEMWLICGLARDRFAILSKTHHSMWDGISGIDLHSVILDDTPDPRPDEDVPFRPEPEPSGAGMLFHATRDRVNETIEGARTLRDAVRSPRTTFRKVTSFGRQTQGLASSFARPAPASALNAPIGSRRRYAIARGSLAEVKDLKYTLGTSVNDAILAAVAGAIRQWQVHRGEDARDVKVMVPVSVRSEERDLGNRVAMVAITLPVTERTSLMRLDRVHTAMEKVKRSGQAAAGKSITDISGVLPPAAIAAMTRMQSIMRPFNLVVTNIPGPTMPLYLLGRRLVELFPQAPLATNQGLSIAALSYDGKIGFGLLADHDSIPDVGVLASSLEGALDDLAWAGGLDAIAPSEPGRSAIAELAAVQ